MQQVEPGERQFWTVYNTIKTTDGRRVRDINEYLRMPELVPVGEELLFETLANYFADGRTPSTDEMTEIAARIYEDGVRKDLQAMQDALS